MFIEVTRVEIEEASTGKMTVTPTLVNIDIIETIDEVPANSEFVKFGIKALITCGSQVICVKNPFEQLKQAVNKAWAIEHSPVQS